MQLLVYYYRSSGAKQAVLAAAQLARASTGGITVLIGVTNGQKALAMQNEVGLKVGLLLKEGGPSAAISPN